MTKEEFERIKQAYESGLKVQIWSNGYWENFDIREYSMYSEPFSMYRQYRIVGSAYADIAEKRITELEAENAELKKGLSVLNASNSFNKEQLTKAKEIIKDQKELLDMVLWGAETLSDFDQNTLDKAEQFLKEVDK